MFSSLPHLLTKINALIRRWQDSPFGRVDPDSKDICGYEELGFPEYSTLEKYTGISLEAIPPVLVLKEEEWLLLADAFKQLFKVLNIIISDLPNDYPDDEFIELIRDHWDVDMIYYKGIGFDLSCCTGNNETCPYGEECTFCGPNALKSKEIFEPEIGGFFRDDGTRVDPMTITIPDLCLNCKSFLTDDWEENILCTLTRMDHKENQEFICYDFRFGNNYQDKS